MKQVSEQRSRTMRAVRSRDTGPELVVRKLVHALGYRFRLYRRDLPGCPDLVFPRLRKVVFVHGCFWHGHTCRRGSRMPKMNRDYWFRKIANNKMRSRRAVTALRKAGWSPLVLWECALGDESELKPKLAQFLAS